MIVVIGPGFIGSHLRQCWLDTHLTGEVEPVILVGRRPPVLPLFPHETFMLADTFAGPAGDVILAEARAVVHLVSGSTVATFSQQPWLEFSENVAPILQLCVRITRVNRAAKLIFASSGGAIYGPVPGTAPINEAHPCAPISSYGLGKLCIEQTIAFAGRTMGLAYNILRISNPVGRFAQSRLQGLVSVAMNALETGEPVTVFGDGSHVRDLIDADDVAEAIIAAIASSDCNSNIWNVGSGLGISNLAVLSMVSSVAGRTVPVRHTDPRPQDVPSIVLDCSRIKADLGWQAHRDISETTRAVWERRVKGPSRFYIGKA